MCVCPAQSRFSLRVAKLVLICLGVDFPFPSSEYSFINVIIVTNGSPPSGFFFFWPEIKAGCY